MQTIESKLAKITSLSRSLGLTDEQARHLIHGTGGSPRRAKRALRLGIHQQLIDAYTASLEETGAHATAVIACNKLWAELVPATEPGGDDDVAGETMPVAPVAPAAVAKPKSTAMPKAKRGTAAKPATNPAALRDLLDA